MDDPVGVAAHSLGVLDVADLGRTGGSGGDDLPLRTGLKLNEGTDSRSAVKRLGSDAKLVVGVQIVAAKNIARLVGELIQRLVAVGDLRGGYDSDLRLVAVGSRNNGPVQVALAGNNAVNQNRTAVVDTSGGVIGGFLGRKLRRDEVGFLVHAKHLVDSNNRIAHG